MTKILPFGKRSLGALAHMSDQEFEDSLDVAVDFLEEVATADDPARLMHELRRFSERGEKLATILKVAPSVVPADFAGNMATVIAHKLQGIMARLEAKQAG